MHFPNWLAAATLCGSLALAWPSTALAQGAAAVSPAPVSDAQRAAFAALPEADRKAMQSALVWLGLHNGSADGSFGARTRDSIQAFQAGVKAELTGMLDAAQIAALESAAQKARDAVGFKPFDDPASGIRIGAPLKILDRRSVVGGAAKLQKADGSVTLELRAFGASDADLAALYAQASAPPPDGKIVYKAMRPDIFFVVSGEAAGRRFYMRYEKAPAGSPNAGAVRGFRFAYPAAQAGALDRVSLAIADSFAPFAAAPTTVAAPAPSPRPIPSAVSVTPLAVAAPSAAPAGPILSATGLIVAPGQALSAFSRDQCPNPLVDGKPATFLRGGDSGGLTLLGGNFGSSPSPLTLGDDSGELVILSYAGGRDKELPTLQAAAAPAMETAPRRLLAALPGAAPGSPAFDRAGRLAAMVGGEPPLGRANQRPGLSFVSPHEAFGAAQIAAFLGASRDPAPAEAVQSAGQIARAKARQVVAIFCLPGNK